jgi:Mrp family chromosome partitioning ATPase
MLASATVSAVVSALAGVPVYLAPPAGSDAGAGATPVGECLKGLAGFLANLAAGKAQGATEAAQRITDIRANRHMLRVWLRTFAEQVADAGDPDSVIPTQVRKEVEDLIEDEDAFRKFAESLPTDWVQSLQGFLERPDKVDPRVVAEPCRQVGLRSQSIQVLQDKYQENCEAALRKPAAAWVNRFVQTLMEDDAAKEKFAILQSLKHGKDLAILLEARNPEHLQRELGSLGLSIAEPEQALRDLELAAQGLMPVMQQTGAALDDLTEKSRALEAQIEGQMKLLLRSDQKLKEFLEQLETEGTLAPVVLNLSSPRSADDAYKSVNAVARTGTPNAARFYSGGAASWEDIAHEVDFRRELQPGIEARLRQANPAQKVIVHIIESRSGEGKSTLLMRLAYELATSGLPTVWLRDATKFSEEGILHVRKELKLGDHERLYLFMDSFGMLPPEQLAEAAESLNRRNVRVTLVGADVISQIGSRYDKVRIHAAVETSRLAGFSEFEAERLVAKLEQFDCLGRLAAVQSSQRVQTLVKLADNELIVALLEGVTGEKFALHVAHEFGRLHTQNANHAKAVAWIALRHQADFTMSAKALADLMPGADLAYLIQDTEGMIASAESVGEATYRTRHRKIAAAIVAEAKERRLLPVDPYSAAVSVLGTQDLSIWIRRLGEYDLTDDAQALLCHIADADQRAIHQARVSYERWRQTDADADWTTLQQHLNALPSGPANLGRRWELRELADRLSAGVRSHPLRRRGRLPSLLSIAVKLYIQLNSFDQSGWILREALVVGFTAPEFASEADQAFQSHQHLTEAIRIDPDSGFAHRHLGALYRDVLITASWRWDTLTQDEKEIAGLARQHLTKAIQADPDSSFAHQTLGALYRDVLITASRRWDTLTQDEKEIAGLAHQHLTKAVQADPDSGFAHEILGALYLDVLGVPSRRWDTLTQDEKEIAGLAHQHLTEAIRFDPDSSFAQFQLAWLELWQLTARPYNPSHDPDLRPIAERWSRSSSAAARLNAAWLWLLLGEVAQAREQRVRALDLFADDIPADVTLELALWDAIELDSDDLLKTLKAMLHGGQRSEGLPFWSALKVWPKAVDAEHWETLCDVAAGLRPPGDLDDWSRWVNLP